MGTTLNNSNLLKTQIMLLVQQEPSPLSIGQCGQRRLHISSKNNAVLQQLRRLDKTFGKLPLRKRVAFFVAFVGAGLPLFISPVFNIMRFPLNNFCCRKLPRPRPHQRRGSLFNVLKKKSIEEI